MGGAKRYAARGFELDVRCLLIAPLDGGVQLCGRHVIKEHDIGAGGEDRVELIEVVDFDFDQHFFRDVLGIEFGDKLARAADGVGGREVFLSGQCEVVVFDEDGVEEARAVVMTATAADGVLFEAAPAGRGFASVVNAGSRAGDAADILAGKRGDAGKAVHEVEHWAFAREQVAGTAREAGDSGAGGEVVAVGEEQFDIDIGLHFIDDDGQRGQAGYDAGFAGGHRCPALGVGADEGDGGPVLLARKVLANGEARKLAQVVVERGVPG